MRLCRGPGGLCVPRPQSVDNRPVLADHRVDPFCIGEGRGPQKHQRVVEGTRRLKQEPVAAREVETPVEFLIDRCGV